MTLWAFLGVEVRIVDWNDRPVPPGTVGETWSAAMS